MVEIVGGGYVINGATQSSFLSDQAKPGDTLQTRSQMSFFETSIKEGGIASVLGQDKGYMVKYTPLPEGVPKRKA